MGDTGRAEVPRRKLEAGRSGPHRTPRGGWTGVAPPAARALISWPALYTRERPVKSTQATFCPLASPDPLPHKGRGEG